MSGHRRCVIAGCPNETNGRDTCCPEHMKPKEAAPA